MTIRRDQFRYKLPPTLNGSGYTTGKQPTGQRAVPVSNAAVSEIKLTGDVFLAPPDASGNSSANDFKGDVVLELVVDGDDVAYVVGPSGGGAAGPTYQGLGPEAPTFAASATQASGLLYNKIADQVTFTSGTRDHRHDSLYVIARNGTTGVLHYRVISTLPSAQ